MLQILRTFNNLLLSLKSQNTLIYISVNPRLTTLVRKYVNVLCKSSSTLAGLLKLVSVNLNSE